MERNKKNDGIYLLTSKDCPYCIKNIDKATNVLTIESERVDFPIFIVPLDINEYFNDKNLNDYLDCYGINSIPCILFISKKDPKINQKLIEFEDIRNYTIK